MYHLGGSDKFANPLRFGLVEIEFGNIRSVQVHGVYRSRSSSIIFVLSPNWGIPAQISCMESKIAAFVSAGRLNGVVIGRNSAIGSPRRSISITPPSAASRTSSEV